MCVQQIDLGKCIYCVNGTLLSLVGKRSPQKNLMVKMWLDFKHFNSTSMAKQNNLSLTKCVLRVSKKEGQYKLKPTSKLKGDIFP